METLLWIIILELGAIGVLLWLLLSNINEVRNNVWRCLAVYFPVDGGESPLVARTRLTDLFGRVKQLREHG